MASTMCADLGVSLPTDLIVLRRDAAAPMRRFCLANLRKKSFDRLVQAKRNATSLISRHLRKPDGKIPLSRFAVSAPLQVRAFAVSPQDREQ